MELKAPAIVRPAEDLGALANKANAEHAVGEKGDAGELESLGPLDVNLASRIAAQTE
jgi:hypothetical protein